MTKKQPEIPGFERESIAELDERIGVWLAARHRKLDVAEIEKHAHDACQEMLADYELERYLYVDGELAVEVVRVAPPEKLAVKKVARPAAEEEAF